MATTILFLLLLISSFLLISPALCSTNVLYSDLSSPNDRLVYGHHSFGLSAGCNLVLYDDDTVVWETGSLFPPVVYCTLTLQPDGELVVRGSEMGRTFIGWRSGVRSTVGRYALVLKYDGTVHVYGPTVWSKPESPIKSTDRSDSNRPLSTLDSTFWTGDIAPIGTTIAEGDYRLELHGSCNLTLSDGRTDETLWYSDTRDEYDLYDCFVSLADNGELAIKYIGGAPLWTSGATGPAESDYVLALRPDGNAAVYGPSIWFAGAMNETGGRAVTVGGSHADRVSPW